jgi:CHAT domain-containing protein/Tfp pilus assembly protein PilF
MGEFYKQIKQYDKAENYYLQSAHIRLKTLGEKHANYLAVLAKLVDVYEKTEKKAQADSLYKRIQSIYASQSDTTHYVQNLERMALLYQSQNKFEEAVEAYQKVLDSRKKLGESHPDYQRSVQNLSVLQYDLALAYDTQGLALYHQKQYHQAIEYFEKAIQICQNNQTIDRKFLVNVLEHAGDVCQFIQDDDASEKYYSEALRIAQKLEGARSPELAQKLNILANIYYEKGEIQKAQKSYETAIEIFKSSAAQNPEVYVNALLDLGKIHQNNILYSEAEKLYTQARDFSAQQLSLQHPLYADASHYLAGIQHIFGKYEEAENLYVEALAIRKLVLKDTSEAYLETALHLAKIYQITAQYAKAETSYQHIIALFKQKSAQNSPHYWNVLKNLSQLYDDLGKQTQAQNLMNEILNHQSNTVGEEHPKYASMLTQIAFWENKAGKTEKAEELFKKVLQIQQQNLGEQHPEYATALDNLGNFYLHQKRIPEAESHIKKALQIRKQIFGENHPAYAASISNMASLLEWQNQKTEAEKYYLQTMAIFKNTLGEQHPHYAQALNNLALFYENNQNYDKAYPLYKAAKNNILYIIQKTFSSLSEEEKQVFYDAYKTVLDNFQIFATKYFHEASQNKTASGKLAETLLPEILIESYELQLITKGIVLNATRKARNQILDSKDKNLIALFKKWQTSREVLAKLFNNAHVVAHRQKQMDSLNQQINQLEKNLLLASPLFAQNFAFTQPSWKTIQAQLKPQEVNIEMIRLLPNETQVIYVALMITPKSAYPQPVIFVDGIDMETKNLSFYKNNIRFQTKDTLSYQRFWKKINDFLVKEMPALGTGGVVYFSPDGVYHLINPDALWIPEKKMYLSDVLQMIRLTNSQEILKTATLQKESKQAILLGRPQFQSDASKIFEELNLKDLPATETEVNNIALILKDNQFKTQVLLGDKATETNLKQMRNTQILHIATHGFFNNILHRTPSRRQSYHTFNADKSAYSPLLQSGLFMSNSSKSTQDNGILTAYEVMNLNLEDNELVVLSACETGLGQVQTGEGVYGLQRAFKIAGAQSLLMSLWEADDKATAELMTIFYQNIFKNMPKYEALRKAQQQIREKYPNPFYWAGFVLIGE